MMTPLKSKKMAVIMGLVFGLGFLVLGSYSFSKTKGRRPKTKKSTFKVDILHSPVLLLKQPRQSFALEYIQTAQHFRQRQLVFQIHLVVEIGSQTILPALPVLRHHD